MKTLFTVSVKNLILPRSRLFPTWGSPLTLRNGQLTEGDIYWADLDPTVGHEQAGRRPVLILSRPAFNDRSGTVIVVALTSAAPRAGFPLTLELTKTPLPKKTWVKI